MSNDATYLRLASLFRSSMSLRRVASSACDAVRVRQRGHIHGAAAGEPHCRFEFADRLPKHLRFLVGLPERQVRRNEFGIQFNHVPVLLNRHIVPARKKVP